MQVYTLQITAPHTTPLVGTGMASQTILYLQIGATYSITMYLITTGSNQPLSQVPVSSFAAYADKTPVLLLTSLNQTDYAPFSGTFTATNTTQRLILNASNFENATVYVGVRNVSIVKVRA